MATNGEVDCPSDSELFSFMSLRRPEFISIAGILKAREESAKTESFKDLSASIAALRDKNEILEKELLALRNNEAELVKLNKVGFFQLEEKKKHCVRLEGELAEMKKSCMDLRESEKLAQQTIKYLMEEVRNEREQSANRKAEDDAVLTRRHLEIEKKEVDLMVALCAHVSYSSNLQEKFINLESEYSAFKACEESSN